MSANPQELTPRQRRFVELWVSTGARNQTQIAIAAGYAPRGAHVSACRTLKLPHVIEAIRLETERVFAANVPLGIDVIHELAKTAKSETVRLQAAQALLDRGGLLLVAKTEHRHVIEDRRSDAELEDTVVRLARELGLSAKVIDGQLVADPVPSLPAPAAHADPAHARAGDRDDDHHDDDDADPFS